MSDFLTFIFIDLISTGLFYLTGSILIPIFTLGRVVAGGWSNKDNDLNQNNKSCKVLGAWYAMVIGGLFWIFVAVLIWRL